MKAEFIFTDGIAFMVNSMFISIGILILVAAAVAVNNLLHRYWRPVRWVQYQVREIEQQLSPKSARLTNNSPNAIILV